MTLPLSERAMLAQTLWQSIEADVADAHEQAALREVVRHHNELSSGIVAGRTHEEVVQAAQRVIGCV